MEEELFHSQSEHNKINKLNAHTQLVRLAWELYKLARWSQKSIEQLVVYVEIVTCFDYSSFSITDGVLVLIVNLRRNIWKILEKIFE